MWTRSLALLLLSAIGTSVTHGEDACSLTLSASSATSWQVSCADGSSSSKFDPSLLTGVSIGEYDAVEFKPATAPQPVELRVPMTFAKVGELISPTLTSFSLQRATSVKGKPEVEIDGSAFAQMSAMKKLFLGYMNLTVDGPIELPPSLTELTIHHAGLVDFDVKIKKGSGLKLTNIDLRWNNLRRIPLFVFALRRVVFINLGSNKFPALRLSRRKLRRLLRLIAAKRILLGEIADFIEDCEGEKKTIQLGASSYLVCEVEAEDDDALVLDDDDVEGSGSSGSSDPVETTESPAPTTSSSSSSNGTDVSASPAPTPSQSSVATSTQIGSMATIAVASTALLLSSLV